ncbi:MAG: extracellular solute-binding protein [Clostridia bacterium]|nr:extracellular solute-binding protein [Clostridia bacterium]
MKIKRIASLLLAMIMLAACGEPADKQTEQNAQTTAAVIEETTAEETRIEPNLPDITFDGADFTHLGTGGTSVYQVYYATNDLWAEEEIGEPLNDAVYRRNVAVEDKYKVKINLISDEDSINRMQQAIRSDDCPYDVVWSYHVRLFSAITEGWFLDLKTVPHLDLSAPWWDQNIQSDLTLSDKVYLLTGDITTTDDGGTFLVFFNKYLVEQYNLASPYELVNSGNWTLAEFSKMVKAVSEDLNGTGEYEEWADRFGLLTDSEQIHRLYLGLGGKYFEGNAEDGYRISITDEKNFNRLSELYELIGNEQYCAMLSGDWDVSTDNIHWYSRAVGFGGDHYLFCVQQTLTITELRDMENEFGILPLPKYDTTEERYYAPVDTNIPVLALMINTPDLEKSAIILEALANEGMYTVTPVYNETLLERKYTRDDESVDMLKVIAQSRIYDLMGISKWGGIYDIAIGVHRDGKELKISDYEKKLNAAQKLLDKNYDKFMENE